MATEWSADGPTEALARRLAVLTSQATMESWDPARHRKPSRPIKRRSRTGLLAPVVDVTGRNEPRWEDFPGEDLDLRRVVTLPCEHIQTLKAPAKGRTYAPFEFQGPTGDPPAVAVRKHRRHGFVDVKDITDPGPLLSEVVVAWDTETRPRVRNRYRITLSWRRFMEFCGDRPINTYTRKEVLAFIEALRDMPKMPPRSVIKLPMPVMLKKFADDRSIERLTDSTRSSYPGGLQTVFNWAYQRFKWISSAWFPRRGDHGRP